MRSHLFLPLLLGFSFPAIAQTKTYKIDVSAESYRNYILNGTDRNESVSGNYPTVTVNKGDTIIFNVSELLHPFYIKAEISHGICNQVITGKLSGTAGTQNGSLAWNKTGVAAGTYFYVCSTHTSFGMGGSIIIE